ncbi:hypothetical protein OSB04_012119 [Centaurea solstitialis]|uniref:Reverse transcriptase zinc-binding domain-containing protein n=1 Tax=Centaurea solstitialis TaxID=347529 RepID=A0AA38TAT2_9ASTR|nr:hypothetical protein OSB04_012119 [Centaurea solstitialis]
MSATVQVDADLSGKPVDQKNYRAIIGSLLYLTASRPHIVFSTCFTDSDHTGCKLNRKSSFEPDHVEKGNIEIYFVESEHQLADLFTKSFDEKRHFYLLNRYLRDTHFWTVRKSGRWSWVFSKIMDIRPLIRASIKVLIGNGLLTNAWDDNWVSCGPLSSFITPRFVHNNDLTMHTSAAELISVTGGVWPTPWVDRMPILVDHPMPSLSQAPDVTHWFGRTGLSVFSVKLAYEALQGKDRMMHWKEVPPDMKCSLCKLTIDSHDHLFFQCRFAMDVWQKICSEVQWRTIPNNWDGILDFIADAGTRPKKLIHKLALSATIYAIWREGNRRLFTKDKFNTQHIVSQVLSTIRLREAWKRRRKRTGLHEDN